MITFFLFSLNGTEGFEKITTWLIDHPYFWSVDHEFHCIKFLVEGFRRKVIEETLFVVFFTTYHELKGWRIKVSNNALLNAIYCYKGDYHYLFGDETRAISFVHAVMNHANDRDYGYLRGPDVTNVFLPLFIYFSNKCSILSCWSIR